MRFFNSKIESEVIRGNYFITSERFNETYPKEFTVRIAMEGGSIETLPKFQAFKTKKQAIEYINSLPEYLPQALQFHNECFNTNELQKFVDQALIEPTNDPYAEYTLDSFTGACSWLCDHSMSIDDAVLKHAGKMYRTQLDEHINEL